MLKRTLHVGSKIWILCSRVQEQYLTRSLRSLVRYCFCHSNIKFISSRHRVISSIYLTSPFTINRGYYMTVGGMNFIFECSTRYLTSERSERVRYRVEHEKINFISTSQEPITSGYVIFWFLYKHTNDDDFPKISDQFPKIFQNCCKNQTNVFEHFPDIFRRLPKISEEGPVMFRSYSNTSEYFLRDYVAIVMIILLFSRVKISCLRAKAHLVSNWCLYNKVIYQTRETVFHRDIQTPKREFGIRGVWIADETLSRVFDTSSQSKKKLSTKRRSKIVKIYVN